MISSLTNKVFPRPALRDVGDQVRKLLVMDCLRYPVYFAGQSLARRVVEILPFANRETEEGFELFGIPGREQPEFTPIDTMVSTAGMCSQVLFYAAFYSVICSLMGPMESWGSLPLLLGPWWSSSYWMEWIGYDFIRSAVPLHGQSSSIVGILDKWISHQHRPELGYAYKHHKICLCFCAIVFLSVCALIYEHRPAANHILMERASSFLKSLPEMDFSKSLQDCFDF